MNEKNIFFWKHKRRYNSYSEYFKKEFGTRVQKVTVDAGFTCPNRDGTLSYGGCSYCNNNAFNPSYCNPKKSINQQIEEGIIFHQKRYRRAKKYLAYFQPYSNTYAPVDKLKNIYNEAIANPNIFGIVIGTRPDCIDDEKLEFFKELSEKTYLVIEYGIESCYNKTLQKINRCHTFEQTAEAIIKTSEKGIKTCGHLILGLPGETRQEILAQAPIISKLPLTTVKLHQLQIFRNTSMAEDYKQNRNIYSDFSLDEYLDLVIEFVERLNPSIVVERISGEAPPRFLVSPSWGLIRTDEILRMFEQKLEERNTWQGRLFGV
jgi:radical SAM protein (TIGR01212 family)